MKECVSREGVSRGLYYPGGNFIPYFKVRMILGVEIPHAT